MKRIPRHIAVPALLLVYLAVMAVIGIDGLRSGQTTLTQYVGTIAATLLVIALLYFFMKKRDKLRRERLDDIEKNKSKKE